MSLLLQALQKAAKNRDQQKTGTAAETQSPAAAPRDTPPPNVQEEDPSVQDRSEQDTPALEKSAADTPAHDAPTQDTPTQDNFAQDASTQDIPTQEIPARENPFEESSTPESPPEPEPTETSSTQTPSTSELTLETPAPPVSTRTTMPEPPAPTPRVDTAASEPDASLSLEPVAEPQLSSDSASQFNEDAQPISTLHDRGISSPADAADVMRANAAGSYSPLDWVRDHHMLTFLAAAALFAIFYGLYVYLQISNPGLFRSAPPPIAAPVQVTQAPPATMQTTPAQSAPAPAATGNETPSVTGMPEGQAQTASAPQGAGSAASETRDEPVAAAAEPAPASDTKIRFVPVSQSQTPARAETQASTARPRSRPAQAVTPIETRTDSDGVEVVEIPAPPSVAALPPGEQVPATSGIAVERQSTNRSPIDPELMAAYEALVQGDYQKASTLYGKVLVRSPDNADAMLGLAAIAWKQGRPSVASGYYARVLERDPRNSHAQAGLIALLGSADPVAAETKLKQLISREPSGFLYFTLGNLYAEQGLWSQAQYAYFQAYQLDPDNPDYAYNLAVGLEHLGQSRPALDHYRKALDLSFKKGRANFDQELAIERVGQLSARIR